MKIKNNLLTIILTALMALNLAMPCYAVEIEDSEPQKIQTTAEINPELMKVLRKFAKSIILVALSGGGIYTVLSLYKRFNNKTKKNQTESLAKDLNSPETIDDAVKLVIEKF